MSRVRANNQSVQEWTEELLRQRGDTARHEERRNELAARVRSLEIKYGIESRNIHDAIEQGRLKETHEVTQWIMDYELLQWPEGRAAG